MPRPPRLDDPGTWHHVMNRGLAHRPIFEARADIRFFLSRVAQAVRRGELEIHAWCLMTTHFHLLAYSPRGELDVALRRIQHEHTRRFNRRRGRDGPLYRSRFTSKHVDSFAYRSLLVHYIDSNPVEAGMVEAPPLHLDGSASWYVRDRGPVWMERTWIEGEVQRRTRKDRYDPADYPRTFGAPLTAGVRRMIERRLRHPARDLDPIDDLLARAPADVTLWLVERARLADGIGPGIPLTDAAESLEFLREERAREPAWSVRPTRESANGWDLLEIGLLRSLCGATYAELAELCQCSASWLCSRHTRHALALERDPEYARRAQKLARTIVWRTFRGHETALSPGHDFMDACSRTEAWASHAHSSRSGRSPPSETNPSTAPDRQSWQGDQS